jgi:hypothetical protein
VKCAAHPDEEIAGTCARCGDFVCARDSVKRSERVLCAPCAESDPERLRVFKEQLWGKRDAFAWYFGIVVGSANLVFGVSYLSLGISRGQGIIVIGSLASFAALAIDLAYLFRLRFARVAVVFLPVVGGVVTLMAPGMRSSWTPVASVGCQVIFSQLVALAGFLSTRNKLFFRIDVPDDEVARLWDFHRNNPNARRGLFYSIAGIVVPPLLVLGLFFCAKGLAAVDPSARPPIGRRGQAIAGIVISIAGLVAWAALVLFS